MTGAHRVLWQPEDTERRLAERLHDEADAAELQARLALHGDVVTEAILRALEASFDAPTSYRSRVVVLAGTDFTDLLQGFHPAAQSAVGAITARLRGSWPALSDQGVEGRWTNGTFQSMAGVLHEV